MSSSRNPSPASVRVELFPAAGSADTEWPSKRSARLRGRNDWELYGDLAELKSSQPFVGNFLTAQPSGGRTGQVAFGV